MKWQQEADDPAKKEKAAISRKKDKRKKGEGGSF
jgi:hypothetical protein